MKTLCTLLLVLALSLSGGAWADALGFSVMFDGSAPPQNVQVSTIATWDAGDYITLHDWDSAVTLDFDVPAGQDTSTWVLTYTDRVSASRLTPGEGLYTRPIVTVNGTVVSSDVALWAEDNTHTLPIGGNLNAGASNRISFTLGGDSQCYYQIRSISVGPPAP